MEEWERGGIEGYRKFLVRTLMHAARRTHFIRTSDMGQYSGRIP